MPYKKYKTLRLKEYDYSKPGAYFVTTCAKDRASLFGNIQNGLVLLSAAGEIAAKDIIEIPNHYNCIDVGEYIIMPNHIHMVIYIYDSTDIKQPEVKSIRLQDIIGSYKAGVTRKTRLLHGFESFGWQRYYFDHIIRNDRALENISDYIRLNPARWMDDLENLHYMKSLKVKERESRLKILYKELCFRNVNTASGKP